MATGPKTKPARPPASARDYLEAEYRRIPGYRQKIQRKVRAMERRQGLRP